MHILIASTKSQMYTFLPQVYLIKVWTNSRSGKMQWNPKMNSKFNNFCKLDLIASFSIWSSNIFAMKVLYLATTRLHGDNILKSSMNFIFFPFEAFFLLKHFNRRHSHRHRVDRNNIIKGKKHKVRILKN